MAVKLIHPDAKAYQGYSTDEKPTAPMEGSTFRSIDTDEQWTYFDGIWELDPLTARVFQPQLT